jgi:hypothetical protein
MSGDPIVEEVREVRRKIETECQNDAQKYYEHLQQVQEQYGDRLVQRKPKAALERQQLAV